MGITIFAISGDWGSNNHVGDFDASPPHAWHSKDNLAHVGYPSSSLWVTTCGGTYIQDLQIGRFHFNIEGTWNETNGADYDCCTGGGISELKISGRLVGLPVWQNGLNIPSSKNPDRNIGRGIPDVAGNASRSSPYAYYINGRHNSFWGTSAVAPLYAGLVALLNANLGDRIGYLNPTLYSLAGSDVFLDIADGVDNKWVVDTGSSPSYSSDVGWDACTGLGRINGNSLLAALQNLFRSSNVQITCVESTIQEDGVARSGVASLRLCAKLPSKIYRWTIRNYKENLICTALVSGFARPVFTWRINGQDFTSTIADTPINIPVNVKLDNPQNPHNPINSTAHVDLSYTNFETNTLANGLVVGLLDIKNNSYPGHIIFDIEVFVTEKYSSRDALSSSTKGYMETQGLFFDNQFQRDSEYCNRVIT